MWVSSLLEALNLYAQDGAPPALLELLRTREQLRPLPSSDTPEALDANLFAVQRLFYQGGRSPSTTVAAHMGPLDAPESDVSIELDWRASDLDTEVLLDDSSEPLALFDMEPVLVVNSGTKRQITIPLSELGSDRLFRQSAYWAVRRRAVKTELASVHVGTHGVSVARLGSWWQHITLTPMKDLVLEALRIVEPSLKDLSVVTADAIPTRDVTVLALLNGDDRPVPLRSLGDGMSRVLGMVFALVMSKGGLLLIDEVENGLHYSIQADLWRLLFRTAKQLDVQVFATSHSWDSIVAFKEAAAEDKATRGYLLRLLRKDGDVVANILDERKLAIATRQDIEVR